MMRMGCSTQLSGGLIPWVCAGKYCHIAEHLEDVTKKALLFDMMTLRGDRTLISDVNDF